MQENYQDNHHNQKKYYKLFSVNLLRFIKIHGIRPISKGVHPITGRSYWVFEMSEELSELLTIWSNNKQTKDQKLECKDEKDYKFKKEIKQEIK